jgi:hypothetical protein
MFRLSGPLRFTLIATAFVAALIVAGCSGSCECSVYVPRATGAEKTIAFTAGTLTFPQIESYAETFTIASATPSSGVTANVITSVAAPAQLPSMASTCTPSTIVNPLLYISFQVTERVTVVPGQLVITLPASVSNSYTFYQEFDDVTNPTHQCAQQGTVNGQTVTFPNTTGSSMTLYSGNTYEFVLFHSLSP